MRKGKRKIISVVGARPNLVKIFPLLDEIKRRSIFKSVLVHTGQHYSRDMSGVFFKDFQLPEPDIYLGIGSGTHAQQTARVMAGFEEVLIKESPDLVIVVGDVNSTMACAVTCAKLRIPVAHIEAGLRSFDRAMPEEINRIVTDSVANYLFAPSADAVSNLKKEGFKEKNIFFVGNIMIDSLVRLKKKSADSEILNTLGLKKKDYAVLTLHRPSNVDDKVAFENILDAIGEIQKRVKVVFPVHPRTKKVLRKFGLGKRFQKLKGVILTAPLGYLDFLHLMSNSKFIMTDSGGIQEETTILKIPCLTLRDNTERPITVKMGTNTIVGNDAKKITDVALSMIDTKPKEHIPLPKFWDGKTAERIISIIVKKRGYFSHERTDKNSQ